MKYSCIWLDFYGTLVEEDDAVIRRIVDEIARESPRKPSRTEVAKAWRFADLCTAAFGDAFRTQCELEILSLSELIAEFSCTLDAERLSQELFTYWRQPKAFPESGRFLEDLSGVPLCVVSNIDEEDLTRAIDHNGWDLETLVTSESCRSYKPRPEMFERALDLMGIRRDQVLHVGDSWSSDVIGAFQFGVDVAWVNRKKRAVPVSSGRVPEYVVSNLGELLVELKKT